MYLDSRESTPSSPPPPPKIRGSADRHGYSAQCVCHPDRPEKLLRREYGAPHTAPTPCALGSRQLPGRFCTCTAGRCSARSATTESSTLWQSSEPMVLRLHPGTLSYSRPQTSALTPGVFPVSGAEADTLLSAEIECLASRQTFRFEFKSRGQLSCTLFALTSQT